MDRVGDNLNEVKNESKLAAWAGYLIFGVALAFYFYEFVLRITPSLMSSQLMQSYHLTMQSYGNLSAIYYYVYAPMQLLVGLLLDRYGVKRLLAIAALISVVGCYCFANGSSVFEAVIGRCLVGLGASFSFLGVLKLASQWFDSRHFAFIAGLTIVVGLLGGLLGDFVLMYFVRYEGWRLTLYLIAVIGALIAFLLCVFMRDAPSSIPLRVTSGQKLLIQCARLLRNPQIWINGAFGCLLYLPVLGFTETWQIPYLAYVMDYQRIDAVTASAMVFGGSAVMAPLVGWLSEYLQQRRILMTLGAMLATVLMATVLYVPALSHDVMYFLLFLYGMSTSVYVLCYVANKSLSPPALTATALAVTHLMVMLSGVSVIAIGSLIESAWHSDAIVGFHAYGESAYQIAFTIFPAGLFIAVLLTFFMEDHVNYH